jgi:uncharacterized protein (DUF362 family)
MDTVGITRSTYVDVRSKIGLAIERGGKFDINDDNRVVIKINLCDFRMPDTGAITHPLFLDAILNYLRSSFNRLKIFVVESDATVARPNMLIRWLGFKPIIKKYDAKWVNLTKDVMIKKQIKGRYFKEIDVPKIIQDSDYLITMAKLKTHTLTKITCSLKNQFGCIPISRKVKFHNALDDVIVDACLAMKPDFCIVDGITAMGGKGPDLGVPIQTNIIVTGKDPVSVDAVCARIMGFNPYFIGHIRKAQESGVGQMSYEICGEEISSVQKDFEYSHILTWAIRFAMFMRKRAVTW